MVRVYKHFEVSTDEKGNPILQLFLHSEENWNKRLVEGLFFTPGVTVETLELFVRREKRQLDNYFIKGKTGNYSIHVASKHNAKYSDIVKAEIEFWEKRGIILL